MARQAIRTPPTERREKDAPGQAEPAAQQALAFLRQAAGIRPDTRLYEEALDVWLTEGKCGRRIVPSKSLGPQDFPVDFKEAPVHGPFRWSLDGRWLLLRGVLIDLQNGKTEPLAVPNPQTAIMDGSGNVLVANSEPGVVTVYDRATGAKRSVIDRRPNKVEQWHFVPAGERLAVVVASDKTERKVRAPAKLRFATWPREKCKERFRCRATA